MSAFMHSDKHIAFVVGYACEKIEGFRKYSLEPMTELELAQLLVDTNADSIQHRYGDDDHHSLTNIGALIAQVHKQIATATLGQFVQAVRSLRYQSCEHPEYEGSEGSEWITRLLVAAAEEIPCQDVGIFWAID